MGYSIVRYELHHNILWQLQHTTHFVCTTIVIASSLILHGTLSINTYCTKPHQSITIASENKTHGTYTRTSIIHTGRFAVLPALGRAVTTDSRTRSGHKISNNDAARARTETKCTLNVAGLLLLHGENNLPVVSKVIERHLHLSAVNNFFYW